MNKQQLRARGRMDYKAGKFITAFNSLPLHHLPHKGRMMRSDCAIYEMGWREQRDNIRLKGE